MCVTTGVKIENILLSQINHSLKDKYCESTSITYLEQSKLWRQKVEWWLPGADGGDNEDLLFNGYGVSVLEDGKSSGDSWW